MPKVYFDGQEIVGSNSGESYSTDEVRIGTWIDGKPLYRKTFIFTMPAKEDATSDNNVSNLNVAVMVNLYGFVQGLNGTYRLNATNFKGSDGWGVMGHYLTQTKMVRLTYIGSTSELASKPAYVTIEYTKTTD